MGNAIRIPAWYSTDSSPQTNANQPKWFTVTHTESCKHCHPEHHEHRLMPLLEEKLNNSAATPPLEQLVLEGEQVEEGGAAGAQHAHAALLSQGACRQEGVDLEGLPWG
jgi:hypothetical protein